MANGSNTMNFPPMENSIIRPSRSRRISNKNHKKSYKVNKPSVSEAVECKTCITVLTSTEEQVQCADCNTLFCLPCTKIDHRQYMKMCRRGYEGPKFRCYECEDAFIADAATEEPHHELAKMVDPPVNANTVNANTIQEEPGCNYISLDEQKLSHKETKSSIALQKIQQLADTPTISIDAVLSNEEATNAPTNVQPEEDPNCPICRENVEDGQPGILCETCNVWSHRACLHLTQAEYEEIVNSPDPWICARCLSIRSNKITWGKMEGEENIGEILSSKLLELRKWKKNIFLLPRGKSGTDFIKELSRLINLITENTKWSRLAMKLIHLFVPIMLQKPSIRSKAKENAKYLQSRLQKWSEGDLDSLMSETREIQRRLNKSRKQQEESREKAFCRLMLLGKVGKAMGYINNDDLTLGVHPITAEVKALLQLKHPEGRDTHPDALLPEVAEAPEPVIFERIDAEMVQKAALHLHGSGGPTLIDADGWRHILCSKVYGRAATSLCQSVADLAKKLCTEQVDAECLEEYVSCRLIPLDKGEDKYGNLGLRPIGIGEIIRRLVTKVVIGTLRDDIVEAAGPLQTCAGIKCGIEASIHAMKQVFDDESTEAVLLVDAENAFNRLNRKAALHNIKELCPPLYQFLRNTYQAPANMLVADQNCSISIKSDEGTTQGDVAAMAMYAIAMRPLVDRLGVKVDKQLCKQVWYADDSTCIGKMLEMKKWWSELVEIGPKFGYFPKPSKTILIVKDHALLQQAEEIFLDTGIKITMEGERHLGAAIGSAQFRSEYVQHKVEAWAKDIEQLSIIAKDEPQAAYAAFTKALCHRWGFLQRTVGGISELFTPLEEKIRDTFIPAIIGRKVNDAERRLLALPVRHGGMGIQNPVNSAEDEYKASKSITENLAKLIQTQATTMEEYDKGHVLKMTQAVKKDKEKGLLDESAAVQLLLNENQNRCVELAKERGSGSWLSALPIQSLGYVLNKQEFRDSICLRYGWKISNTPSYCGCGEKNDVDHTLNCKTGGYIIMRHNCLRDLEAEFLKEVCRDVKIEPELLPIGGVDLRGSNIAEKARLDVSAVGLWSPHERSFVDVRVMHPNSPTYRDKTPEQLYTQHEREKKRNYNQRVLQVEKASFTPLVFTTTGGMGPECNKFHKRLATLISNKKKEEYSHVINHIRTRVRFSLLKSILVAIRGVRGKHRKNATPISELSFNLIPSAEE